MLCLLCKAFHLTRPTKLKHVLWPSHEMIVTKLSDGLGLSRHNIFTFVQYASVFTSLQYSQISPWILSVLMSVRLHHWISLPKSTYLLSWQSLMAHGEVGLNEQIPFCLRNDTEEPYCLENGTHSPQIWWGRIGLANTILTEEWYRGTIMCEEWYKGNSQWNHCCK